MSESTLKITRTIRSKQVLNAFVELVRKSLPLDLKKTWIAADDILYALAYAIVHSIHRRYRLAYVFMAKDDRGFAAARFCSLDPGGLPPGGEPAGQALPKSPDQVSEE